MVKFIWKLPKNQKLNIVRNKINNVNTKSSKLKIRKLFNSKTNNYQLTFNIWKYKTLTPSLNTTSSVLPFYSLNSDYLPPIMNFKQPIKHSLTCFYKLPTTSLYNLPPQTYIGLKSVINTRSLYVLLVIICLKT